MKLNEVLKNRLTQEEYAKTKAIKEAVEAYDAKIDSFVCDVEIAYAMREVMNAVIAAYKVEDEHAENYESSNEFAKMLLTILEETRREDSAVIAQTQEYFLSLQEDENRECHFQVFLYGRKKGVKESAVLISRFAEFSKKEDAIEYMMNRTSEPVKEDAQKPADAANDADK